MELTSELQLTEMTEMGGDGCGDGDEEDAAADLADPDGIYKHLTFMSSEKKNGCERMRQSRARGV